MTVSLARNAASIFVGGQSFSPLEVGYARAWFNRNNDSIVRGRLAHDILLNWVAAGSPEVAKPAVISATIFFRRIDSKGRPNGKVRTLDVNAANMPGGRGRPKTRHYVEASGLQRDSALITRIVTDQGAVHSVSVDEETGHYVYRWESKADQRDVVVALHTAQQEGNAAIAALQEANRRLAAAGLPTVQIDA